MVRAGLAVAICAAGCWTAAPRAEVVEATGAASAVEVVVRDPDGFAGLAVDERHVYWLSGDAESGGLFRADKEQGASATKLAAVVDPVALAIDAATIYFVDDNWLVALPKSGGEPRRLRTFDEHVASIAVAGDELVVATSNVSPNAVPAGPPRSQIWRVDSKTGADRSSAALDGARPVIALGNDGIFAGTTTSVFRIDREGFAKRLFDGELAITAIAFERDTAIGYVAETTRLRRFQLASRARPDPVADVPGRTTSIASDDRFVYWNALADDEGAIYRQDKRSGTRERLVETGSPAHLVIDGPYLYWTDADRGRITRRRR